MLTESNSYKAAVDGFAHPALVKMNLATHHDWSDKQKQQIETTNLNVEIEKPEVEESEFLAKWREANTPTDEA